MQKIIILAPGKSGTTYLHSILPSSVVLHEIGRSRFKLKRMICKILFFLNLMFIEHLVIMPHRPDKIRKKSVFWNDFELALMNFKTSGKDYKKLRYEKIDVFLQGCFDNYPYETYEQWFIKNSLKLLIKPGGLWKGRAKFFNSEVIMCPLDNIDELLSELEKMKLTSYEMPKLNTKKEFWHRTLHDKVK